MRDATLAAVADAPTAREACAAADVSVGALDALAEPVVVRGAPGDEPATAAAALGLPLADAAATVGGTPSPHLPWWTPAGAAAAAPDLDVRVVDAGGGDGPRWRPVQWALYCAAREAAAGPPARAASGASIEDEADSAAVAAPAAAAPALPSPRGISAESKRRLLVAEVTLDGTPLACGPPAAVAAADAVPPAWPATDFGPPPSAGATLSLHPAGGFADWCTPPGGACTWIFGLAGRRLVLCAPPTPANEAAYAAWARGPARGATALAAALRGVVRAEVRPGDAAFVPAGWLAAAATPADHLPSSALVGGVLLGAAAAAIAAASALEDEAGAKARERWPAFERAAWRVAARLAGVVVAALPRAAAAGVEAGVARRAAARATAAAAAAEAAAEAEAARLAAAAERAERAAAARVAAGADRPQGLASPGFGAPVVRLRLPPSPAARPASPPLAVRLKLPPSFKVTGGGGERPEAAPATATAEEPAPPADAPPAPPPAPEPGPTADAPPAPAPEPGPTADAPPAPAPEPGPTADAPPPPAPPPPGPPTPPPPATPVDLSSLPFDARPSVLAAAPALAAMLRGWAALPGVLAAAADPGADPGSAPDRLVLALRAAGLPAEPPAARPPRPPPPVLAPLAPRPPPARHLPSPPPLSGGSDGDEAGDSFDFAEDVADAPAVAVAAAPKRAGGVAGAHRRPAPPRSAGAGGGKLSVKDRLKKKLKIR